jgi:DNA-binding transcriptional ArsR family regulator
MKSVSLSPWRRFLNEAPKEHLRAWLFATIFNLMVEYDSNQLDRVFSSLGDPTRRTLLQRLCLGPASVTELAAPMDMSLNAVSKHLKVLEQAGLIRREIEGRVHHVYLNAAPLENAERWVNHYRQFWDARLESLASWLEREDERI